MSRLDKLIAKYCPNGVDFVPLWSVTAWDKKFNAVDKSMQSQIYKYPVLLAKDLFAMQREEGSVFLLSTGTETGWTTEEIAGNYLCEGEVVTLPWGKSSPVKGLIKYYNGKFVTGDNRIATSLDKNKLLNKYLYYWMVSQGEVIDTFYRGSGIKHPSMFHVLTMKLPVPPLEVQREIVHILDYFTLLTAELTAELTARKKQYEFYRDKLLSHDGNYPMKPLADLGKWSGGKTPSMSDKSFWEDGTIPWILSKDMKSSTLVDTQDHITEKAVKEASMTVYPANSIAVVTRSGILKHTFPVAYVPFETTINQDIKILVVNEDILPRYAFHVIQGKGNEILAKTKKQGGTVDSLDFQKVLAYKVPVPSKDVQGRLVEVLDNFEAICTDLNIGLPAEIEARQKQYEYYRDLLLTFAETGSTLMTDRQTDRAELGFCSMCLDMRR